MNKLLAWKPGWLFLLYVAADTICIGLGMGVPFFCILFGFPLGWFLLRYVAQFQASTLITMKRTLIYSILAAAVTMLGMVLLWAPTLSMLFEPGKDLANFGIPMILYEPRASFIGWIVLMIVISPVLQLLATSFSAYVALLVWMNQGSSERQVA